MAPWVVFAPGAGVEMSDGRVLKLDSTGNAKASEAMKANARSASGSKSGAVVVTVTSL